MSDVMLHGILNMPPGIWDNSDIHKAQRHDAYKQASKRIKELEKERDSANLVIAKIANDIIDLDNIDQDSHQVVHCWDDIKEFALLTLGRCES